MTQKTTPNCGKCGLCLNVCPVYSQLKEEQVSPRAKMQLIKSHGEQSLSSTPLLKDIVSKCLMCGACAATCPSGIDHYSAFIKMREKMVQDHGDPLTIRSLIYLLSKEYRLKFGTGIARTGQKLLPEKLARSFFVGNIPADRMPRLNHTPFRKACGPVIRPDTPAKGRVAYFTGCATNYLFDDTGFAAVGILKHMGYEIVLPEKQSCCAIPLLFHGASKQAHKNITANIRLLKDLDADHILVDCSTCGEALGHIYPVLFEDHTALAAETKEIAEKTMDLFSFIDLNFDDLAFTADGAEAPVATYHAPCHSRNRLTIHNTVEKLLEAIPGIVYRPTADMAECCGGGGTFFYEYPDVAQKMMDRKRENVASVQAGYWLTDCPVCRINLGGSLEKADRLVVTHPLSLIYKALKPS